MYKKRRESKYKACIVVHEWARSEVVKFVDQYQFISDAAKDLGCSYTHLYMIMNGFAWPSEKLADKMESISGGLVKAEMMIKKNYF